MNSRPFTYNNGTSGIENSTKIGNLSIGYSELRYDNNPGGKTWWMGPDESNLYVIGKDVPTEDWPTPIGNVGNVKFWGSIQTDNGFLDMVNNLPDRIGQGLFETPKEAYGWLLDNGYWTNYPYVGYETGSLWNTLNVRNSAGNKYNQNVFFNSASTYLYVGYGTDIRNAPAVCRGLYNFSSSMDGIPLGTGSNYFYSYGTSQLPGESKYDSFEGSYVAFNYSSSKLYTVFGTNDNQSFLVKYNLNSNTIETEATLTLGKFGSEDYYNNKLVYNSYNDRIYLPYTDYTPDPDINEIYIYDGTNLNFLGSGSFIVTGSMDEQWPQLTPNPNNGEILQLRSNIIPNKFTWWNFNNISSPTFEVYRPSINWRLTTPLHPTLTAYNPVPASSPFPFSPTQDKFYITGFQTGSSYASLNGNGNAMLVLDGSSRQVVDIIYLGGSGFGTSKYMLYTVGVYDELRDYVWTFNLDNNLVVVNCATNKVIGEFELENFTLNTGYFRSDVYYIPSLALDNTNNLLYYAPDYPTPTLQPIQSFDLTDIISQLP